MAPKTQTAFLDGLNLTGLSELDIIVFSPLPNGGESNKFSIVVSQSTEETEDQKSS